MEVKAASAKAAADNAEAVASAAMSAAESAVREEMEAAAVAKSTASALNSVVAELKDLGVSFETSDKLERTLQAKGVSRVRPPSFALRSFDHFYMLCACTEVLKIA